MSLFVPKEWKDRLAEFAGRRKLTNISTGEETTVDVSRAEGEVSQEGHAFSAANMNDLEQRIKDGFDKVDSDLGGVKFGIDGEGNRCYLGADGSLIPFKSTSFIYGYTGNAQITLTLENDYSNILVLNNSSGSSGFSNIQINDKTVDVESVYDSFGAFCKWAYLAKVNGKKGDIVKINRTNNSYTMAYFIV